MYVEYRTAVKNEIMDTRYKMLKAILDNYVKYIINKEPSPEIKKDEDGICQPEDGTLKLVHLEMPEKITEDMSLYAFVPQ